MNRQQSVWQHGYEADYDFETEENHINSLLETPSWKDSLFRLWVGGCCPTSTQNNNARRRLHPDAFRSTWITQKHLHLQKKQPYPILPHHSTLPSQLKPHYPYWYHSQSHFQVPQPVYPKTNAAPMFYGNHQPQPYPLAYNGSQNVWASESPCGHDCIESSLSTTSCSSSSSDESAPYLDKKNLLLSPHQKVFQTDVLANAEQTAKHNLLQSPEPDEDDHFQKTNHNSTRSASNHRRQLSSSLLPPSSGDSVISSTNVMGKKTLAKPPLVQRRSTAPEISTVKQVSTTATKKSRDDSESLKEDTNGDIKQRPRFTRSHSERVIKPRPVVVRSQSERGLVPASPPRSPNHRKHLPPSGPSSVGVSSPRPGARARTYSDFSRESTNTTSSRHRRNAHEFFEFDASSLNQIAGLQQHQPQQTSLPPIEISCDNVGAQGHNSEEVESTWSWDYDDQKYFEGDNDSECSLSLSTDDEHDAGYISSEEEEDHFPSISRKDIKSQKGKIGNTKEITCAEDEAHHEYLPTSPLLDADAVGTVIVSGWAAVSVTENLLSTLMLADDEDKICLKRSDISYFQLICCDDNDTPTNLYKLVIHQDNDESPLIVDVAADCHVTCRGVGRRAGRCVVLQDGWERKTICTILPVSLPKHFFVSENRRHLVSELNFDTLAHGMLTPFGENKSQTSADSYSSERYAPDAQNDASMHIIFAFDAALSKRNSCSSPLISRKPTV